MILLQITFGAVTGEIGKFLLGCLIFGVVVWVGMLIGKRNDEMRRLKEQNDDLLRKQKYHDAHLKHLQKKAYPDEE